MTDTAAGSPGQLIGGRYRLERPLTDPATGGGGAPAQGRLWLARDQLAADAPCALRQLPPRTDQARAHDLWGRLQGVLHPQVPRFGAAVREADSLWLVRDWQAGRTYGRMLAARAERQMVFGAGEVLLLLRQLLPVLAALHSQELLHGDLSPDNLLRRDSDGLPVLLDFGLVRGTSVEPADAARGATPGYAPPELLQGEPAQPWMDLHALGVVALVLLSGDPPASLLDPVTMAWRWPVALESEPALREQLQRLLERDPARRFSSAGQALTAFQALTMPDSTGPVPRADRTVMLVPPPSPGPTGDGADMGRDDGAGDPPATEPDSDPRPAAAAIRAAPASLAADGPSRSRSRALEREEAGEGGLWPVLVALVLSAVVGTALGWWWLSRGRIASPTDSPTAEAITTLPPGEVDQRQQLLDRLRALQIERGWFLDLVNASLLAQYPERRGRLPGDGLEDAPLRRVWNGLAEEWLARVEQLPIPLRQRLGSFQEEDWRQRQEALLRQGISASVLQHLVSANAQHLLGGRSGAAMPAEPFRQLWYAAADQMLENLRIEPIQALSASTQVLAADVPAGGARLFPIRLPPAHGLALGVNGSPLLQMTVYAADGGLLEPNGPLRVVTLPTQKGSPVQLLVTNDGVAAAPIRLSLRADPAGPAAAANPAETPAGEAPPLPPAEPPLSPGQEPSPPAEAGAAPSTDDGAAGSGR